MCVVFRANPWIVRGDPLVGHQESVLRHLPAVVGPPVLRETFYFYCSFSEALGVSLGARAAFRAARLRIYRPARSVRRRCRYRVTERRLLSLVRYYSANNDIVIVSGLWCVSSRKYSEYVGMWDASFPKLDNLGARHCPAKDSVCVNIPHRIF